MAHSSFDFDGGVACALSSVKQEGLTLMAEQTQALKLLSEGRDDILRLLPRKEGAALGHLFLVVVWPRI